jgi:predicted nucleotidyltransferase component of viral defense system
MLRLKVETNTREHFAVLGLQRRPFAVNNPWFAGAADVLTYDINELLGTKLRALYQRRKGRDLFDLWLCLQQGMLNVDDVIRCFSKYMQMEEHAVSRAQFERNLYEKSRDPTFLSDLPPLLAGHIHYDVMAAMACVKQALIEQLPGDPWAGA